MNTNIKYLDLQEDEEFNIPLVRKKYDPIYVPKLVGIQPLLSPAGLELYLRANYSKNNKNDTTN